MKEKLIVQIVCDKEVGTAFYVAPDLLLTAYHTVASFKDTGCNIVKDGFEGDLKFEIIDIIESSEVLRENYIDDSDLLGFQKRQVVYKYEI